MFIAQYHTKYSEKSKIVETRGKMGTLVKKTGKHEKSGALMQNRANLWKTGQTCEKTGKLLQNWANSWKNWQFSGKTDKLVKTKWANAPKNGQTCQKMGKLVKNRQTREKADKLVQNEQSRANNLEKNVEFKKYREIIEKNSKP